MTKIKNNPLTGRTTGYATNGGKENQKDSFPNSGISDRVKSKRTP